MAASALTAARQAELLKRLTTINLHMQPQQQQFRWQTRQQQLS
jgi:hypothetical protein